MNDIICPQCNIAVDIQRDLNSIRKIARCRSCSIQFTLDEKGRRLAKKRAHVDISQLEITNDHGRISMSYPWKTTLFMKFFALLWNWAIFPMFFKILSSYQLGTSQEIIPFFLVIIYTAIGLS